MNLKNATWNPSDKHADITLSAGNLTATNTAGDYRGVRTTLSVSSGKHYIEFTRHGSGGGSDFIMAVATSAANLASVFGAGADANGLLGWSYTSGGLIYHHDSGTAFGSAIGNGQKGMIALDLDNSLIWFGVQGVWQGGGNPETLANPSFTGVSGTLFIAGMCFTAADSFDLNVGGSSFTYTPPNGYNSILAAYLDFEGTEGSTVFTDTSGKIWSPSAGAHISTVQFYDGASSLYLDGVGDHIITSDHSDFDYGAGDFAIQAYLRPDTISSGQHIFYFHDASGYSPVLILRNAANLLLYMSSASLSWDIASGAVMGVLTAGVWKQAAVVRRGTSIKYYFDNALIDTIITASALTTAGAQLRIGSSGSDQYWDGYIDDLKIINGTAYIVIASAGANGVISPGNSSIVLAGDTHTVTITPDPNYDISDVLVDGVSVGAVASYDFTNISADHTISATFALEAVNSTNGLLKISPTLVGRVNIKDNTPQYWFQWGQYVVIEPVPDAVYPLKLYVADYPDVELTLTTDSPTSLPEEFRPCIIDFACYVLSIKLKKWKQAAKFYNLYIKNLKKRKQNYINRQVEKRTMHRIPDNVKYESGTIWAH